MKLLTLSFVAFAVVFSSQASVFADSPTPLASVTSGGIDFTNIVENSTPDDLFGQPTAAGGNTLDFPAGGFSAIGIDGGLEFLNGAVSLTASSNNGQSFSSVTLDEFGVFFNTGDSISSVDAFLTVIVDGDTYTGDFGFDFGDGSGTWDGSITVTFPETFNAEIFIHNNLLANSVADEVASINKRDVRLSIGQAIPEPSVFGMMIVGLVGVASRRRR